jgi:hypothetical protein
MSKWQLFINGVYRNDLFKEKQRVTFNINHKLLEEAEAHKLDLEADLEELIMDRISPKLSKGEKIVIDFSRHIEKMRKEKNFFLMDKQIDKIFLKNVGRFDKFETEFKKFNVILGPIGSGKTTLINAIAAIDYNIDLNKKHILKKDKKEGYIEAEVKKNKVIHFTSMNEEIWSGTEYLDRCILIDDMGSNLDDEKYLEFLYYLRQLDCQVILSTRQRDEKTFNDFSKIAPYCNFIDLGILK